MKPGALCNWIGTACVVAAIILHIACLVTPYYSVADFNQMKDALKDKQWNYDEKDELVKMSSQNLTFHYGLWEICAKAEEVFPDGKCIFWLIDEPKLDPGTWLKAARSLLCIGAAIMAKSAIGATLNLVVVSRGDRQRYLPFIICGFCCVGGFFTFVGDMVIAANYKSLEELPSSGIVFSQAAKDLIGDNFSLGWGFSLDIFSAVLACIAGGFHLLARYQNKDQLGSGIDRSQLI